MALCGTVQNCPEQSDLLMSSTSVEFLQFGLGALTTPGSNDSIGTVRVVPEWLCRVCTSQVSCFAFWCLADLIAVYSLDLEPSVSPSMPDGYVQTFFVVDGWP